MLRSAAPFPFAGASAFLRPTADHPTVEPCRITQRRGDGLVQIALTGRDFHVGHADQRARASGTRTVDLADLAATEQEACGPAAKPRRRRSAR